jgi:CRP-like cAMP-binding protein
LHFITKADLLGMTAHYPILASTLLATVFGTLRQLTGLVEQVSGKSVTARLASFLLAQTADDKGICLDISQREVAALVGTRREVVSRALGKLEKDGILQVIYPQITILDGERLRRIAS